MTRPSLSKQQAFMVVFDNLQGVLECIMSLLTAVEERLSEQSDQPVGDRFTWEPVFELLTSLEKRLQTPTLRQLETKTVLQMEEALSGIKRSLPAHGQTEVEVYSLAEGIGQLCGGHQNLEDVCSRLAVTAFGVWGACWFGVARAARLSGSEWTIEVDLPDELRCVRHDSERLADEVLAVLKGPSDSELERQQRQAIEDRNRWVYERVMAGIRYSQIVKELKSKPVQWPRIISVPGVKSVALRYAIAHELPKPEPRSPGRPPGK